MSKKRIVVMVSGLIIVIGLIIGLCQLLAPGKKEITEEDYKENPKYLLEEVIVSEDGKHFELPKVKKVWSYNYGERECNAYGIMEVSKKSYNSIINQLENDLKIKRKEDGEYKDDKLRVHGVYAVEKIDFENTPISELQKKKAIRIKSDVNITYIFKSKDCRYQTDREGEMIMFIYMIEKYDKYYVAFNRNLDFRMFEPKIGEQKETQTGVLG